MLTIRFETKLFKIGSASKSNAAAAWTLLRLPESASAKLPSRGMTMVQGTINGISFQTVLEPDGRGSHWFRTDKTMLDAAHAAAGDTVTLVITPSREWQQPKVPSELKKALVNAPRAHSLWIKITPNAQWDWIRWIRATKQPQTRKRRIEVACSKLKSGERRPCCFNRNLCTEPYVSNKGRLLEPSISG